MSGTENPIGNMMAARQKMLTEIKRTENLLQISDLAFGNSTLQLTNSESGPLGEDDGPPVPVRVEHDGDSHEGREAAGHDEHERDDPGGGQATVGRASLAAAVDGQAREEDSYPRITCSEITASLLYAKDSRVYNKG